VLFQQWIQMVISKKHFVQNFFRSFDLAFSLIFSDFFDI
jgi:hypothetical protein